MNKEKKKTNGIRLGLVTFLVIAMLMVYFNMPRMVLEENDEGFSTIRFMGNTVSATENHTITVGASGFLEIFFINHTATPATAYDTNTSSSFETWCNASLDPDAAGTTYKAYSHDGAFSLTIKWGVAFDILVRYRGNATCAKNATMFKDSSCRVKINATGGGVTLSEVTLTNVVSYNSSSATYIYLNAYANNGGSGYTLNKGGTCTITNIKIEFNY